MRIASKTALALTVINFPLLATATGQTISPVTHYYFNGQLVGDRSLQVGDPSEWNSPVTNFTGTSASGKVVVSPTNFRREGDAMTRDG
jgi:hypothetical protein